MISSSGTDQHESFVGVCSCMHGRTNAAPGSLTAGMPASLTSASKRPARSSRSTCIHCAAGQVDNIRLSRLRAAQQAGSLRPGPTKATLQ